MLLFVLLALPVSFLWIINDTYLNREFYRNDLVDFSYDFLIEHGPDFLEIEELNDIPREDLQDSFRKIFSRDEVREFADVTLDDLENSLKDVRN